MLVSAVISRLREVLNDGSSIRWKDTEFLSILSDAQSMIVRLRPEANMVTRIVECVAGLTKQTLPATAIRLLKVNRNMGADSATPGRAITKIAPFELDAIDPLWHSGDPADTVENYVYDPLDPTVFWIYPRAHATTVVSVEVAVSELPAQFDATGNTLALDDSYVPAIIEFGMYRALMKEQDSPITASMIDGHLNAFYKLLGIYIKSDDRVSPDSRTG